MSVTWHHIATAVRLAEASEKDRLLTHIAGAYGDHAADQVRGRIEKAWNPQDLHALSRDLLSRFTDPKTREILNRAAEKMGAEPDTSMSQGPSVRKGAAKDASGKRDISTAQSALGHGEDEPGEYVDPADYAARQAAVAATAAMRPDRAGTQPKTAEPKPTVVKPGERPTHDVGQSVRGSAPQHTRPAQHQTSQTGGTGALSGPGKETVGQRRAHLQGLLDKDPEHPHAEKIQKALANLENLPDDQEVQGPSPVVTNVATDLEGARKSLEQLRQRQNMLPQLITQIAHKAVQLRGSNPQKSRELAQQAQRMRSELDEIPSKIKTAEQSITRMTQTGKTGLGDAQRQVDQVTKNYGPKLGDKLAKKLGVPTTADRTREIEDPDTKKKEKKTFIWSAEKIERWKQSGPELGSGVYDAPAAGPIGPGGEMPTTSKLPTEPDPERQGGGGERELTKPMMMAPKGLSKDELQQLANLRWEYNSLKAKDASEHELALKKDEINAIMAKGGEKVKTVMPGPRDGATWRPSGMSKQVMAKRPDKVLGKDVRFKREIGPEKTGQMLVWSTVANDWVLPSQKVTIDAEKGAAARAAGAVPRIPKTGERRPHASQAQSVKGTPVSTSANVQKAQAKAEPIGKSTNLFGVHRRNKDVVQQAYGLKKPDKSED